MASGKPLARVFAPYRNRPRPATGCCGWSPGESGAHRIAALARGHSGGPGARGRIPGGGLDESGEGAGSACRPVGRRVCGSGEVSRDRALRGSAGARAAARARGNRAVGVAKRTPSRHPCPPQGAAVVDRRYPTTSPPPSPAGTVRKFGRGGAVAVALIVLSIAGRGGRKWSTVSGPVSSDGPLPPRRGNRPTSGSNQGIPNGHGTRIGPQSTALARSRRPYTTPPTPSWKIGSCRTGPRGWGRGRFRPGAPSNRQGREPCDKQDMPTFGVARLRSRLSASPRGAPGSGSGQSPSALRREGGNKGRPPDRIVVGRRRNHSGAPLGQRLRVPFELASLSPELSRAR